MPGGYRLLAGSPVAIGSRAFDVLIALVCQAGQVLSRAELLERAWPGLVVEENNLSVQIAALRRLLGAHTITTVPGIGYRFSAHVERRHGKAEQPLEGPAEPLAATLIGRGEELSELRALLRRHRLVTIVGAGGIGKTRVAQALAHAEQSAGARAITVVELAALSDAQQLVPAVAQALGWVLPSKRSPLEELVEALADECRLLVLDNCEHLLDAVSGLVAQILQRAERIQIVATSQESLCIAEEQVYSLSPLRVAVTDDPDPGRQGALSLLRMRVRQLDPSFDIDRTTLEDALDICRRLDGLPLAIELAAARVPLLGLQGLRQRMDDHLDLLTASRRDGLERHRTLRTLFAWSCSLLDDGESDAFSCLGVFAGSFGFEPARQVLGIAEADWCVAIDRLGSLVRKSLVVVEPVEPRRYRLLESARAYAQELAHAKGTDLAATRRHAQAYAKEFAQSIADEWVLPSQERRRRYLPDLDNGRKALAWADLHDTRLFVRLSGHMAWLFLAAGHSGEGLANLHKALERIGPDTHPADEARVLLEQAELDGGNDAVRKLAACEHAVAICRTTGDRSGLYFALGRLAITAALCEEGEGERGDLATAEMATLLDPSWPPLARWHWLNARDYVANQHRRLDEAEALAREQLVLAREHQDTTKLLFALLAMEQCTATRGRYDEAAKRGRELVAIAEREGHTERNPPNLSEVR